MLIPIIAYLLMYMTVATKETQVVSALSYNGGTEETLRNA
jgi:hypothetical protein